MKTVFILNPKAGQGCDLALLSENIRETAARCGASVQVYETCAVGDAKRFVKEYCEKSGPARFIACGGDGTLSEVLSGAMGCETAEVGVLPLGTGNDFCRNFQGDFQNIAAQLDGESVSCDAMFYRTRIGGEEVLGYGINMFNIGFDCNVADMTARMKQKPMISGSMAYFMSILVNLVKKRGARLRLEIDGKPIHEGTLLLTSVANGAYCGGGIKSNPLASVQNGLLNVNVIKDVSRCRFISLLPSYMKGTFLARKGIDKVAASLLCSKVKITPLGGNLRLCIDGEITDAGETEVEIVKNAVRFVVPKMHQKEKINA